MKKIDLLLRIMVMINWSCLSYRLWDCKFEIEIEKLSIMLGIDFLRLFLVLEDESLGNMERSLW
jgi:hypothetical protein